MNRYQQKLVKETQVKVKPQPLAIGTPFCHSVDTLEQYFTALTKLDYPKKLLSLYFTVQGEDETWELLDTFKSTYKQRYNKIVLARSSMAAGAKNPRQAKIMNIALSRNVIVAKSAPLNLLFIDSDNFPPRNTISRLLTGMALGADIPSGVYPCVSTDADIVGGVSPYYNPDQDVRGLGFSATFQFGNNTSQGLTSKNGKIWFESCLLGRRAWVAWLGMGTTLIHREVLDEVRFVSTPELVDKYWSEDTYFCKTAGEHGFKVMADYGLMVPHWGIKIQFLGPAKNGKVQVACDLSEQMLRRRVFLREQVKSQLKK